MRSHLTTQKIYCTKIVRNGILSTVAKLREQAWMVKELQYFYKNTSYSHPSTFPLRAKNLADDAIPEKNFSQLLSKRWRIIDRLIRFFRPSYARSEGFLLNRANNLDRIYKSCRDDGFIEDVIKETDYSALTNFSLGTNIIKNVIGIRPTTKGTDLLHLLGFMELSLKKYGDTRIFLTGG